MTALTMILEDGQHIFIEGRDGRRVRKLCWYLLRSQEAKQREGRNQIVRRLRHQRFLAAVVRRYEALHAVSHKTSEGKPPHSTIAAKMLNSTIHVCP